MDLLHVASVWLHVLAAMVWVGGMIFLAAVLLPLLRREAPSDRSARLFRRIVLRFRWVGWGALGVLLLTGLANLSLRGIGPADLGTTAFWQGPWGRTLAWKLILVAVTLGISFLHDFIMGPKALRGMQSAPDARATLRLRRLTGWMGRFTLVLALLIVALAVVLVRGGI